MLSKFEKRLERLEADAERLKGRRRYDLTEVWVRVFGGEPPPELRRVALSEETFRQLERVWGDGLSASKEDADEKER